MKYQTEIMTLDSDKIRDMGKWCQEHIGVINDNWQIVYVFGGSVRWKFKRETDFMQFMLTWG